MSVFGTRCSLSSSFLTPVYCWLLVKNQSVSTVIYAYEKYGIRPIAVVAVSYMTVMWLSMWIYCCRCFKLRLPRNKCTNVYIAWRRRYSRPNIEVVRYNSDLQRRLLTLVRHLIPFDYRTPTSNWTSYRSIGRPATTTERPDRGSRWPTQLTVGARWSQTNDDKQPARCSIPSLRGGSGQSVNSSDQALATDATVSH